MGFQINLNAATSETNVMIIIIFLILVLLCQIIFFITCYKKCPADKIMVIYGAGLGKNSDGSSTSSVCIHGGARFIFPIIQSYHFLDLTPISFDINIKSKIKDKLKVKIAGRTTVGISTLPGQMQNAAERLSGLNLPEISSLAEAIIESQLAVCAEQTESTVFEDNMNEFLEFSVKNIETELNKIGIRLININLRDTEVIYS